MDVQSASCRCRQQKEVMLQGCIGQFLSPSAVPSVLLPECNPVDKDALHGAVVEIHQEV